MKYAAILTDAEFMNLVDYRIQLVRQNHIPYLEGADLTEEEAEAVVDYLCHVADCREIYFLWRPFLRDPADEMVLEVAVGAEAECIVTHNVRDFAGVEERFGARLMRPGAFLLEMEAKEP